MAAFATSGQLGVNLATTYAPIVSTDPTIPGLPFALGQEVTATDGSLWQFVVATGGAITQYDFVGIDENFVAQPLTIAMVTAGSYRVGVAQVAFTSAYNGWVCVRGMNVSGRLAGSCAADAQLYITATAGVADDSQCDTSVTAQLSGVVAIAANSDTSVATAKEVALTWPKSGVI